MHEIREGTAIEDSASAFIRLDQQRPLLLQRCIFAPTFPQEIFIFKCPLQAFIFLTYSRKILSMPLNFPITKTIYFGANNALLLLYYDKKFPFFKKSKLKGLFFIIQKLILHFYRKNQLVVHIFLSNRVHRLYASIPNALTLLENRSKFTRKHNVFCDTAWHNLSGLLFV